MTVLVPVGASLMLLLVCGSHYDFISPIWYYISRSCIYIHGFLPSHSFLLFWRSSYLCYCQCFVHCRVLIWILFMQTSSVFTKMSPFFPIWKCTKEWGKCSCVEMNHSIRGNILWLFSTGIIHDWLLRGTSTCQLVHSEGQRKLLSSHHNQVLANRWLNYMDVWRQSHK